MVIIRPQEVTQLLDVSLVLGPRLPHFLLLSIALVISHIRSIVRCFISDFLCASRTISLRLFFFPGVWSYTLCAVSPTESRWQLGPCSCVASAFWDQQKPADRSEPPYFLLYLLFLPSPSPATSVCTCSHTPLICRQNVPQTRFQLEKDNGRSVFFPRRIGTLGKGMLRRILLKPCVHSKHIVSTLFSKDPLFTLYTRNKL